MTRAKIQWKQTIPALIVVRHQFAPRRFFSPSRKENPKLAAGVVGSTARRILDATDWAPFAAPTFSAGIKAVGGLPMIPAPPRSRSPSTICPANRSSKNLE
jgi:hypothetical protein